MVPGKKDPVTAPKICTALLAAAAPSPAAPKTAAPPKPNEPSVEAIVAPGEGETKLARYGTSYGTSYVTSLILTYGTSMV